MKADHDISPDHQAWVAHLKKLLPHASYGLDRYLDASETHGIVIFDATAGDRLTAATIGLMEVNQREEGEPRYTELIMESHKANVFLQNVLSTTALYCLKDGWRVAPGVVYEKLITLYIANLEVQHILFVPVTRWPAEQIHSVALPGRTLNPLQAVPITHAEQDLLAEEGLAALQRRWQEAGTDLLDWDRDSAV